MLLPPRQEPVGLDLQGLRVVLDDIERANQLEDMHGLRAARALRIEELPAGMGPARDFQDLLVAVDSIVATERIGLQIPGVPFQEGGWAIALPRVGVLEHHVVVVADVHPHVALSRTDRLGVRIEHRDRRVVRVNLS